MMEPNITDRIRITYCVSSSDFMNLLVSSNVPVIPSPETEINGKRPGMFILQSFRVKVLR